MKKLRTLASSLLLLSLGLFFGRELFPKVVEPEETHTAPRSRSIGKPEPPIQTTDSSTSFHPTYTTADLMKLVIGGDHFKTSTQLRNALAGVSHSDLENHLNQLIEKFATAPNNHVVKASVLNHLIAKDPLRAFDFVVTHENKGFRNASTTIVIQALARHDPKIARDSLSLISDPNLKQSAHIALQNMGIGASPKSLISILQSARSANFQGPLFPNLSSPPGTTGLIALGDFDGDGLRDSGGYRGYNQRGDTYDSILKRLTEKDFAAAEKYALSIEEEGQRIHALSSIAGGLALKNPKKALAWANSVDQENGKEQLINTVLSVISQKDPKSAADMLHTLESPHLQRSLIRSISTNWIRQDPDAAMTWINALPESNGKLEAFSSAMGHLTNVNPSKVGTYLENLPASFPAEQISRLVSTWVGRDFHSAQQWITQQTDPRILSMSLTSLIPAWADKNPREAADFLKNSSPKPSANTTTLYREVAEEWASSDHKAALAWAEGIESSILKNSATNAIYYRWASADPEGAVQLLSSTHSPDQRKQLLGSLAYRLGREDLATGQEWFSTLSLDDRIQAAPHLFSAIRSSHPAEAATLYDQLTIEGADKKLIARVKFEASSIASNWSQKDPQNAAAWAAHITDAKVREEVIASVAGAWVQKDAESASQWIHQLPKDQGRDRATSHLAKHIEKVDPESAFDWAQSIDNSSIRSNTLISSLKAWHKFDSEAARAAVQSANITDRERTHFLLIYK
jgi:hypothetical protein